MTDAHAPPLDDVLDRISDRFVVHRVLGSGSSGTVYEVTDATLDQRVALKLLRDLDPVALRRFKYEFRFLADMSHRNLVRLLDFFVEEDAAFFTMELLEGAVDFVTYVRGDQQTGFNDERLRSALAQLVSGVGALHAAGVIHRDLKPRNVLVTADRTVKIVDFGLSRRMLDGAMEKLPRPERDAVEGTPHYMAPEAFSGGEITWAADWYGVGALLYKALVGEAPFTGRFLDVYEQKSKPAPSPADHAVGLPEDLVALCNDLLRVDPDDRPKGAEILKALGLGEIQVDESLSWSHPDDLVGRDDELDWLGERWSEALRERRPQCLVIRGEAGVGKSALVRCFKREARLGLAGRPVVAVTGRCHERERIPFAAFDDVMDNIAEFIEGLDETTREYVLPPNLGALSAMFPDVARLRTGNDVDAPARADRAAAKIAFVSLFRSLGRLYDLLIILEDFQWVRPDTVDLLHALVRDGGELPALVLVTERSRATRRDGRTTNQLVKNMGSSIETLELEPLSVEDSFALLVGRPPDEHTPPTMVDTVAQFGGNPRLLTEWAAWSADTARDTQVEFSIEYVVHSRIESLPTAAQRLLETLVVADGPLPQRVAAEAAELEDDWRSEVEALREARLVWTRGIDPDDEIEIAYALVRDLVRKRLDSDGTRNRHRQLADAMRDDSQLRNTSHRVASHLLESEDNEQAAWAAIVAAREARARLALEESHEMWQLAFDRLARRGRDVPAALRVEHAEVLAELGRGSEAASEALLAANSAGSSGRADELTAFAAEQLLTSGHLRRGLAALENMLRRIDGPSVYRPAVRVLSSLSKAQTHLRLRGLRADGHEHDRSEEAVRRTRVMHVAARGLFWLQQLLAADYQAAELLSALSTGRDDLIGSALALEAIARGATHANMASEAEAALEAARAIATRLATPGLAAEIALAEGSVAFGKADYPLAAETLRDAAAQFDDLYQGRHLGAKRARLMLLETLRRQGRWGELRSVAMPLLRSADIADDILLQSSIRLSCNVLWLIQDDTAGARESLDFDRWDPPDEFELPLSYEWHRLRGRLQLALYKMNGEDAWVHLQTLRRVQQSSLSYVQSARLEMLLLEGRSAVFLSKHHRGNAGELLGRALSIAGRLEREGLGVGRVWGGLVRACVATCRGQTEDAATLWRRVETDASQHGLVAIEAVAMWRQAELEDWPEARERAQDWLFAQGVAEPSRIVHMLAPVEVG